MTASAAARPRFAFDLEADGLLADATRIHCLCIGDLDSDRIDAFGPDRIDEALAVLSGAAVIIGHNVSGYDLPLLRRLRGWTPSPACAVYDTLVASRTILPNISELDAEVASRCAPWLGKLCGRHSLAAWGARLGVPKLGADIESFTAWSTELQERCVSDVRLTKALWQFLHPESYSPQAIDLEHRTAAVCERIASDGVPFDTAAADRLCAQWAARRDALEADLRRQYPEVRNWNSRQQIVALLTSRGWESEKHTDKGNPSLDDEVLETVVSIWPEFAGLAEYFALGGLIAKIGTGEKSCRSYAGADGRIHAAPIHIRAPHGRAQYASPNLGGIPNPKKGARFGNECRTLFRAPDGWVLVACDQANLQDRGLAHYLAEHDGGRYAEAFSKGIDTHWQTTLALGLVPEGTVRDKTDKLHTSLREAAKRFRYAFLYGAGAARVGRIILDTCRTARVLDPHSDLLVRLFGTAAHPSDDAQKRVGAQMLDRFITATPGLSVLRAKLRGQAAARGWVAGLDGRRVPTGAQYKALNRIVTAAEAIVCKRWLVQVYDELRARFRYGPEGEAYLTLWLHDEIVVVCRPEIAEQIGEILVKHAIEAAEHYGLRVPLAAEFKIGRDWAGTPLDENAVKQTSAPVAEEPRDDGEARAGAGASANGGNGGAGADAGFSSGAANGSGHGQHHEQHHADHDHNRDGYPHGERDNGQQIAFYVYRHADGRDYLGVKRTSAKQFPQFHWNGSGWVKGAPQGPKIPYRLPELIKAPLDGWVLICAGEKDADTAAALGFAATTNTEGERKGSWAPELNAWFAGRKRVAVMEDNDETGRAHAIEVAEALRDIVPDIRVVTFRDLPEHSDLTDWQECGHGRDDLLTRIEAAKPYRPRPQPSPIRQWEGEPVPELEYSVPDRYPLDNVGLFSGEGGQGKSSLVEQLCVAHALGREWLGCIPRQGPAIYIECEDAERVLHWRLKAIAAHYKVSLIDIADAGFQMYPLADEEHAVLATAPDKSGIVRPTPLYDWLYELAGDVKPVMIGIASSANVFAGNENVRTEVQQFIRLLRRIACAAHGTVLLVTQPSLTGIENKSASHEGLAGTTQWHNGVRARAVMKAVNPEDGIDTGLRVVTFHKNQYGPASAACFVRYEGGLFLPVEGMSIDAAARAAKADEVFVTLLKRFTEQRQLVSPKPSASYAPSRFAEHAEAEGITKKEFSQAMQRLLDAKVIEIRCWGKPSRPSYYLAVVGS
jgi:RecA-family ATPase/DNA polymerase I-like protein with 3'-5' exonuclease and polymerase domains